MNYFVWSILYFNIYFSIRFLFWWIFFGLFFPLLHQLCITVRTFRFKKMLKRVHHPIDEWTFEVACQQIVDILQKQMNCDNPQLPQMWIQKCIWNSWYAWQSVLYVPLKVAPNPFTCSPCQSVLSKGCLVVIKRWGFFLFVYCIRWGTPYFLSANSTRLRQKLKNKNPQLIKISVHFAFLAILILFA